MKNIIRAFNILVLSLPGVTGWAASPPSAQEIIEHADKVRNPGRPFQMNLQLIEYIDGTERNEVTLTTYSKLNEQTGQFRNLVRWIDPPRDRGKAVLMNGTVMWFFDPASKASVRISPQQRLVGQASEGDVMTVNLARDYAPTIIGKPDGETIDDADHTPRKCWHLDLKPIHEEAVYGHAEFWVEKETYRPVKGKFFTDSGRLLKIAYYHKYEEQMGAARPSETIIIDAVNSKLVTTMNSSAFKPRDIPDSWFQRDYLPRIRIE